MTVGKDLEIFLKYLKPESNILEIGCGPGYFSLELARSNHHVTGVDLSPDCIKLAKKTALESSSENGFGSLNYLCGDFNSLNLKVQLLGVKICRNSLILPTSMNFYLPAWKAGREKFLHH